MFLYLFHNSASDTAVIWRPMKNDGLTENKELEIIWEGNDDLAYFQ